MDEYVLLYVANGSGFYSSHFHEKVEVKAGSMLFFSPGAWHSYAPNDSVGWDEYWIVFNGQTVNNRVENNLINPQKEIYDVGISLQVVQLFNMAIAMAREQNAGYQKILSGIADLLLGIACCCDKKSDTQLSKVTQQMNKAKILMYENFHMAVSPKDVAAKLCVSYSWFRYNFKQSTGLSPHQYIQGLRMHRSKELLKTTNLTCREISYKVGYDSPEHFASVFKKNVGVSPTKYRERYESKR